MPILVFCRSSIAFFVKAITASEVDRLNQASDDFSDYLWAHSNHRGQLIAYYRLVDTDMRQPPLLCSGVRLSNEHISRMWTLRKVK
jgi:hypothetical protein